MNRSHSVFLRAALLSLAWGATSAAAPTLSNTRVFSTASGASFSVDGQVYTGAASFLWPAGSKHTLDIRSIQYAQLAKTRYSFTGWADSTALLSVAANRLVITADPAITFYQAAVTVQHAVSLNFFTCAGPDPSACGSPGTVFVNNAPFLENADVYLDEGTAVVLRTAPNPGYVFTGWLAGLGNTSQAYLNTFTLTGPVVAYPQFLRSTPVTVASNPPLLQVLADRAQVRSPIALEWGYGTTHTVGAVTPQTDLNGRLWVFDSWSDTGAATHDYTMPVTQSPPLTITATYVPGGRATFLTDPVGLKLSVDGRDNWPGYNFFWAKSAPHSIAAPAQQTDGAGRGWIFRAWSNGGAAAQDIALTAATVAAGLRLTASYDPLNQTVIQSLPSGLPLQVNGAACATPCTLQQPIGSPIHVSAPASIQAAAGTRLQFAGWSDGPAGDHDIIATLAPQSVTANYRTYYRLGWSSDPPNAVTWKLSPTSPDGFYRAQTAVKVQADPAHGYAFHRWEGDASGVSCVTTVTMTAAMNIRARLDRVAKPNIDSVRNAAADTPEQAVAPGSIVSINGENLAPSVQTGPDSPLAQTLAGVTVTIGDRFLPLLFVSPGQIGAQLPSDLTSGEHRLTIHPNGLTVATGLFTVQRNAPGLLYQQVADQAWAVALHEDGSLVTLKHPARRGELVTLLGTGFGPAHPQPLDGFAVPQSASYPLVDQAELVYKGQLIAIDFAGAAPGRVGIDAIRFRVADPLPVSATVELQAIVNAHESNSVLVPLQ